jgi:hypothetical protein
MALAFAGAYSADGEHPFPPFFKEVLTLPLNKRRVWLAIPRAILRDMVNQMTLIIHNLGSYLWCINRSREANAICF